MSRIHRGRVEKVKQQELDRQINARKTETDRLNEDLTRKTEADGLQQTIDSTASLMTESGQNLEQLLSQRKRFQHTLNVVTQNIDAEQRRGEGLQALSEAQNKSFVALTKRIEEIKVASSVQAVTIDFNGADAGGSTLIAVAAPTASGHQAARGRRSFL